MEILKRGGATVIQGEKKEVSFEDGVAQIDGLPIDFPGEYEKSGIMAHVIEKGGRLLYQLRFLDRIIGCIDHDELEVDEEIADFFGDIDILVIRGSKGSIKTFENLEAKYVVPYGDGKDVFFATLGQHPEECQSMKVKELISENDVVFVNLV